MLEPAPRVEVTLSGRSLPGQMVTMTDENGHFSFGPIPEGTYRLTARFSRTSKTWTVRSVRQSEPPLRLVLPMPSVAAIAFPTGPIRPLVPKATKPYHYSRVELLYATDRRRGAPAPYGASYTSYRSDDTLEYGTAQVTVPPDHRLAELESPSIWTFTFTKDPLKHVVVAHTQSESRDQFLAKVEERRGDIFVFVHGYNVSFEDALRRTGQLVFDLQFKGAAIAYSWPSEERVQDYLVAEGTVNWAKRHLAMFLQELATTANGRIIHVVAHSLGTRVLARALDQLATSGAKDPIVQDVVMAAADIDADEFRQVSGNLKSATEGLTLYVSPDDQALKLSRKMARYARVGEGGSRMMMLSGIDTIDAGGNGDDFVAFLNHSYIGDSTTVIGDLWQLIECRLPVGERDGLKPSAPADPRYWKLTRAKRRTSCPDSPDR